MQTEAIKGACTIYTTLTGLAAVMWMHFIALFSIMLVFIIGLEALFILRCRFLE